MKFKKRRSKHPVPKKMIFAYVALIFTLIGIILGATGVFSFNKFLQPKLEKESKQNLTTQNKPKSLILKFSNSVKFSFPNGVYVPGILRESYRIEGTQKNLSAAWESVYKEVKVLGCSKKGKYKFWVEVKPFGGGVYVIFSDGIYMTWLNPSGNIDSVKNQIEHFSFKSLNKVAKISCKKPLESSMNAKVKFLVCMRSTKNGSKWENDATYKICVIKSASGQYNLISWKIFAKEKERIGCKFK